MDTKEINRLRYRRQYILTSFPVDCMFQNNMHVISDKNFLYTHIDLNVTKVTDFHKELILLGDLFDFKHITKSNGELLAELINYKLEDLLIQISRFSGRFLIILVDKDNIYMIHDAASARKVYYYKHNNGVCCSSQPHLLAKVLGLEMTAIESKLSFYSSEEFARLNNSNIGNTTCYDNVYQLIPNHYLHLNTCKTIRYWPNRVIEKMTLSEVSDKCSIMVKGYMESIANRYKIMLPVTAGKDSRLLLSATHDIKESVYYYINKEDRLNSSSNDIAIPKRLFAKLGLDFHIIDPYVPIDDDFRMVYFENNPFALTKYLPLIYNYYINFNDRVNLPGNFVNIAEDVFENNKGELTGQIIARIIHVDKYDYGVEYYESWYQQCKDLCLKSNLNVLNLLYWEERIANWCTQIQLDKDIAQEDFMPFNSRLLIETMLTAHLSDREKPDFTIFREITHSLWPQTLQEPCNPEFKQAILKISKSLGIMKQVKTINDLLFK